MIGAGPPGSTRASIYAAIALAAALIIGGAGGYALGRRSVMKRASADAAAAGAQMTLLGVTRSAVLDSLDLTPAQRVAIDRLLNNAAERADSAVDHLVTQVRSLTAEVRGQVRDALDGRQRARFDSLLRGVPPLLPRTPVPPRPR